MKVITYLGFTVLSIFIQFSVMDIIQEKILDIKKSDDNSAHEQSLVDDLLKNISSKPHALYYRTLMGKSLRRSSAALSSFTKRIYNNSSVPAVHLGTTDMSTTIFDIIYDENISTTDTTFTTEQFFITTELDNVTEITFLETKNKSSTLPNTIPIISFNKYCGCNLLYKVCDINCCCDEDCSIDEKKFFLCEKQNVDRLYNDGCISHLFDGDLRYGSPTLDNILCVVKTNLPEKRKLKKADVALIGHYNKWKNIQQRQVLNEFKKTLYKQNDPIWLLRNGTLYYLDFPTTVINNYCSDRTQITFLKEEKNKCMVAFEDLEMFHIVKTSGESKVISATEGTLNSSTLNCSTLHCTNWTILACQNDICMNFNKSLNEASCTKILCTNLALKIDYYFYYHDLKIINATIKLHIQNISVNVLPFMLQEITVKFFMANVSLDGVVQFSGNPGYISHLPIIVSYEDSNYTENFFNSSDKQHYFTFPENKEGFCVLSNLSQNILRFGLNKRMKCRYVHDHQVSILNISTNLCKSIQDPINDLLRRSKKVTISPFGNPYSVKDEDWIKLLTDNRQEPIYGEYSEKTSKLHCFNLINRVSLIFLFANVDEKDYIGQNKIILTKYEEISTNASFSIDDISTVITIDINFVDITKSNRYVYAGSPHLNINLPKDFFFPFPPNNHCFHKTNSCIVTVFSCVVIFLQNKKTFQ